MSAMLGTALRLLVLGECLTYLLGITVDSSLHCAIRREISPCTCRHLEERSRSILVTCERMASFDQVVGALKDRFEEDINIALTISYSDLKDLPHLSFLKLGLTIYKLKLTMDNLSVLPETVFLGLGRTEFLVLSDNSIPAVPQHVLRLMPIIGTLDMGRCNITSLHSGDFQNLRLLRTLLLPSNAISYMDNNTFPSGVSKLHLGHNKLTTLNGTLRHLVGLDWLFINGNQLDSLDGELPDVVPNSSLTLLDASCNRLKRVPIELRHYQNLYSLSLHDNQITTINGALSKCRRLSNLQFDHNNLTMLAPDDFAEAESLEILNLSYNQLVSINSSLLPLRLLRMLNLSHNSLEEFSMQDIRGLRHLASLDISHNRIVKLGGRLEFQNVVELESRVKLLLLDHNELEELNGALVCLTSLVKLNLTHNKLKHILPDDFIGLDNLKVLDLSYNMLTTLEETSNTFLPSLEDLTVTYNRLTKLERDFHGLPALCKADLSYNQIHTISTVLVDKTQCQMHGVNRTLNIYLNENPVLCDDNMMDVIKIIEEKNTTKIHGKVNCVVEVNNTLSFAVPMMPLGV